LVDKATFARDKACGDLIGPRGIALLAKLGLSSPPGRRVGEMIVIGPTGHRVVLPARAGFTYPGHGVAMPRLRFDCWLRDAAVAAGADTVTGRVCAIAEAEGGRIRVALGDGRHLDADVVVGADGATSGVADAAGLVDHGWVLWAFAQRAYVDQAVERPTIVLWDDSRWRGFPGYGWLFPGPDDRANVGLGLGLGPRRTGASRAVVRLDAFCQHLRTLGVLTGSIEDRRLGGWLKMGMVGTTPARGRVLLVGDAAGLVNPLQGEGIAPALISGHAAARAVIAGPGDAAQRYVRILAAGPARFASVAAAVHAVSIAGSPRRVAGLGRTLTLPGVGRTIAAPWALYWNDLLAGATPGPATFAAHVAHRAGRLATSRSQTRRRLAQSLLAAQDPQRAHDEPLRSGSSRY
jgi:flavin-dependent dehydrogenase